MGDMKNLFLFLVSLLFIAGCSKQSDRALMDSAKKNLDAKKITEAVADYNNLIKEYPESPLAPEALYKLGTVYQNKMDKTLDETQSLEKAVDYFKQVSEKYSSSKDAPKSLFMAGFIQANDLRKFGLATITYKTFLNKYPNDELAPAAKEELEYMGLTPEQILQKKMTVSK